jgi:hypothetical protein
MALERLQIKTPVIRHFWTNLNPRRFLIPKYLSYNTLRRAKYKGRCIYLKRRFFNNVFVVKNEAIRILYNSEEIRSSL